MNGTSGEPGSPYDEIAELYDPWSRSVTEDIGFYVDEAIRATAVVPGARIVELGIGTGRIAIPVALQGIPTIGVDSSQGMLDICRREAEAAGVAGLLDLRLGDLRRPPVDERTPLVVCPFRAYLHLRDDGERLDALAAARELLLPGGRLVFDVFTPGPADIAETHARWIEREPEIFERAEWDEGARTLTLSVRGPGGTTTLELAWLSPKEWRDLLELAGFRIEALYGWFDRRPFAGGEDAIWIAERVDRRASVPTAI